MISRRNFVRATVGSAAAISLSGPLPGVFARTASRLRGKSGEKIFVVVQLTGGNDGINTLVPFGDDEYYKNRFTVAVPKNQALKVDDYTGMNPAMRPLVELLDAGRLGFVQGVGYPNPNRSHFESMDLWHTAHQMTESRPLGWLGRVGDRMANDVNLPAIHLGGENQPLALAADKVPATSIRSIDTFQLKIARNKEARKLLDESNAASRGIDNPLLHHLEATVRASTTTSQRLQEIATAADRGVKYPETGLAGKLKQVADLIAADIPVRIYYVTLDGFDTHANQTAAHASLLAEMSGAVTAFVNDLQKQDNADRVLVMTFSEFGRRLRENASRGTDHGAASIVQLAGPKLAASLFGKYPSLTDLDQGDLKHSIDYRSLYATILDEWLGVPSPEILGGKFKPLKLMA